MTLNFDNLRWDGFLRRSTPRHDVAELAKFHAGKNILVTGAGGSIGSALSQVIFDLGPRTLVLLDASEQNLFGIQTQLSKLPAPVRHVPILGSIADERCVRDIFERYRPEVIYHAAALKHVPLMEMNTFAVMQNNVFGSFTLATMARRFHTGRLIMISTDKAVNPRSIMGASKRLAELVLLALGDDVTRMSSIRLGNVLGSEGSVVPLFLEQIHSGGPVTVTDAEVERYFMSMEETVSCILRAAASSFTDCGICFPDMGEPIKIVDLARYLIEKSSAEGISITYTGLRTGDKLHEEFVSDREIIAHELVDGLQWIESPRLSEPELEEGVAELVAATGEMNLAKLLATLTRLVPEYQTSAYLLNQVAQATT
ncbi:MAG TPA: polysaccharide biosynthesis protein [Terriglobales bacterium]